MLSMFKIPAPPSGNPLEGCMVAFGWQVVSERNPCTNQTGNRKHMKKARVLSSVRATW